MFEKLREIALKLSLQNRSTKNVNNKIYIYKKHKVCHTKQIVANISEMFQLPDKDKNRQ